MAANPLPKPGSTIPVYIANAATAVEIIVVPGQTIDWQNRTTFPIHITVQPVNGIYPLTGNDFSVPAQTSFPGSKLNAVKTDTPPNEYPFTRGLTEGNGKIIVQPG